MKRFILALVLILSLPSYAGFYEGFNAYNKGDYATALSEFRPLAEQGLPAAQYNLGVMYDKGQGVAQNYAEAVKWYRKAAEQGHAKAQSNLGVMYGKGQGVPQDHVFAHMWFNLSAAQGGEDARKNRDIAAELMTPEQIAQAQKLARDWKPCVLDRQCP